MENNIVMYSVFFKNEKDAKIVLGKAKDMVNKFGRVTVADLLEMTNDPNIMSSDATIGWTDLLDASIHYHPQCDDNHRYELRLPAPIDITQRYETDKHKKTPWEMFQQECEEARLKREQIPDMVNHPSHYQSETGLEVFDVIEAFTFDLKGIEAVDTGNILKYVCRWKKKNGLEDLKKARWYLNRLIDHVQKLEEEYKQ